MTLLTMTLVTYNDNGYYSNSKGCADLTVTPFSTHSLSLLGH